MLVPLGAKPYLCTSQLILDTPSSRKSNGSVGYPAFSKYGTIKEPKQASTCSGTRRRMAMRESAAISSIVPNGKLGADPTIYNERTLRSFSITSHGTGLYHNGISVDQAG